MIFLVVSIDVEPDCSPSWRYSDPLSFSGVKTGIKQRLQILFNNLGIVPTYLINNVVLEDAECVSVFRNLEGKFELGAHLHPEFIEPDRKFQDYCGRQGLANCCSYPPEIEHLKIQNITRLFLAAFGYSPKSFRAGRFSAGKNTIRSLAGLGYLVDSSVTPHVLWNDATRERPVDYRNLPTQPYLTSGAIFPQPDVNGAILEVPVSIHPWPNISVSEILGSGFGLRRNIRWEKPRWLRPVFSTLKEMQELVDFFIGRYSQHKHTILNMMFHNVELVPGLSPYTRTEDDCLEYMKSLEKLFEYCRNMNIQSCSLSELYDKIRK